MKNRYLLFVFLIIIESVAFCQGEFNNWYFGWKAGVSFASGNPIAVTNSQMNNSCVTVTVSDSCGSLLFYSNGCEVFNKVHITMPNGDGLQCNNTGFNQPVLAIQKIDDDSSYFLFTVDNYSLVVPYFGLHYSIINMRLDGGLGDVEVLNKNILVPGGRKAWDVVTGSRHKNNRDAWVVVKLCDTDSNYYASYLISSSGLNPIPVLSESQITQFPFQRTPEEIKISPDGQKLVCSFGDTTEYCLFNSQTGEVDPLFHFTTPYSSGLPTDVKSMEFSIDSKYLYLSALSNTSIIYQYDASKTDSSEFKGSEILVGICSNLSAIQLGPDYKIYGTVNSVDSLNVIQNPSIPGIGCNYQVNAVSLNGRESTAGLPQFIQRYYAYIQHSGQCQKQPISFSFIVWPEAESVYWDFGDPASGAANFSTEFHPSHTYNAPGLYTVLFIVKHIDNRFDTAWHQVQILPSPQPDLGLDVIICQGDSATFDAGFCSGCSYEWTSIPPGFSSTGQTITIGQAGIYEVAVTSLNGCIGRDTIQLTVTPPPLVTNNPLSKSICSGESTNIPLTSTVSNTTFTWTSIGSSVFVTGFSPGSGDTIDQVLINSGSVPETVTYTITPAVGSCEGDSAQFVVTVTPGDSVMVSISSTADSVCEGTPVTYTATSTNGGVTPVFQWEVNGLIQGTNDSVFTYAPVNGDSITCILTSSITICITNNSATSNAIIMTVIPNLPVSISIVASANQVCVGIPVTFTGTAMNGGSTPVYQWQVDGINTGGNTSIYTYLPVDGDVVTCVLTSNENCVTGNPATSNTITMSVGEQPDVSFSACFDTITTLNAKPYLLKGGIPLGGTYSGPGVDQITGYFNPALAGVGLKTISYSYSNLFNCSNNATRAISVINPTPFSCGDSLTDIRENIKYPTIQIGSQCWLAVNLNHGQQIGGSLAQRDNCLVEKYCYNDLPANCTHYGALYQWDEMMSYEDAEEIQGLCPPGWHVPSEADWSQLFAVYLGNAFAGSPLLYTGYSGFNVLLAGVEFFNQSHRFADFASIMWSSTSHGPYKAWSHGMNEYNYSVSYYPSFRSNAFSVRCLRD